MTSPEHPEDNYLQDAPTGATQTPDPAMLEVLAKTSALLAGMNDEQKRAAVLDLYLDADGDPQLRRSRLRAVTDD